MKKTKLLFSILCTVITFSVAAENTFDFYSVTDFGYYPKSDVVSGGTHFAPVTGPYSGVEAKETLKAVYTIPTPGNNFLTEGNKISFEGALALTPVSLTPKFSVSYTPIAFLNLSAGAEIGTGWEILATTKKNLNTNSRMPSELTSTNSGHVLQSCLTLRRCGLETGIM